MRAKMRKAFSKSVLTRLYRDYLLMYFMNILTSKDFSISCVDTRRHHLMHQWMKRYAHKIDHILTDDLQQHLKENHGKLKKKDFILTRKEEMLRCYFFKECILPSYPEEKSVAHYVHKILEKDTTRIALYGDNRDNARVAITQKYLHEDFSRTLLEDYDITLSHPSHKELSFLLDEYFAKNNPKTRDELSGELKEFL